MHASKWIAPIQALQQPDGGWGCFHTLGAGGILSTEQALRRLHILGCTRAHPAMARALAYLRACFSGQRTIPDRVEHWRDWPVFVDLMLATWIRLLDPADVPALKHAQRWADVLCRAFASGTYDHTAYLDAYRQTFGLRAHCPRLADYRCFYILSLTAGLLERGTAAAMVRHVLGFEGGVYYICDGPMLHPPQVFASRKTSRYLAGVQLLARHPADGRPLDFAADWLVQHRGEDGQWDLGRQARDGVYFPLGDDWRTPQRRKADCTRRVMAVLADLGVTLE